MNTIPVLIAPAYNRHDLLLRMLKSIDVPVERGIILDNGMNLLDAKEWYEVIDEMERLNLWVFTPPFSSLGYGGSINFSIMQTYDADWWMWVSNDVQFKPGHLQTVIDRMDRHYEPRIVTGGFTWAAANRQLVNAVGLVDEFSFHPIYFDDNDYQRRCCLAGVEWVEDWDTGTRHGDDKHGASLTIRADDATRVANDNSFPRNETAYLQKWGGKPREEQFATPWDKGYPVWVTRPNVDARRDRRW